jgi:hypothetical protein
MKLSAKFLALFLLVGSVGAPTSQAEDAAPAPEALDALHRFLHVDCEVGEDEPALNDLLRHAEALEPELGRLLLDGPGGPLLDEETAALERAWERRAAFLESNPRIGLDQDTLGEVLAVSRAEFVEQGIRRFDISCREKAVVGLAAIGSSAARRTLNEAMRAVSDEALLDLIRSFLDERTERRDHPSLSRGQVSRNGTRRAERN